MGTRVARFRSLSVADSRAYTLELISLPLVRARAGGVARFREQPIVALLASIGIAFVDRRARSHGALQIHLLSAGGEGLWFYTGSYVRQLR